MALKINLLSLKPIQFIPNCPINGSPPLFSTVHFTTASRNRSAAASRAAAAKDDGELASMFTAEVGTRRFQIGQREEAMEKCRKLLFEEYVGYTGMEAAEVKKKWGAMEDGDKLAAAKEFVVSGWSDSFHPLSARSAMELMDEFLEEERVKMKAEDGFNYERILSFRRLCGF